MSSIGTEKIRILLLDGSGRQVMPILKDLHTCRCHITTLNYSRLDVGYVSRYADKRLLLHCDPKDAEQTTAFLEKEIESGNYDVVFPLSDMTTEVVSKNLAQYQKYINTFVPDYATFMKAYDKQQTMDICQASNIPCPLTKRADESLNQFLNKLTFPIAAKPRSACGSIGFYCIRSKDELDAKLTAGIIHLDDYLLQEYIDQSGKQYNIHLFMDENEELSFAVPTQKCRWFPIDGGSSCFCRVIPRPDLVELCFKLLKEIHWHGYCEIEMIEDPKTKIAKVMEINGRTSACIKIVQLLGINAAMNMIELALGKHVTKQQYPLKDVRMRCIHTDLLWLLKSPNRFHTEPGWFNNIHTRDQIFSIDDPLPFFSFSLQSVLRYKTEMKKRERSA